jgi:hypothetical protein
MPNLYCPSCGSGIKYLYNKPEKCVHCEHEFAVAVKISKSRKVDIESDDEDEDEYIERPKLRRGKLKIKSLKMDVESPHFEELGEVVGSSPGEKRQKRAEVSKGELRNKIFKAEPTSID